MRKGPDRKEALEAIFRAALKAASPEEALRANLRLAGGGNRPVLKVNGRSYDLKRFNRVIVLGAGKAAPRMARALEGITGPFITGGVIATKYGHSVPLSRIRTMEAGHPIPDGGGLSASAAMLNAARGASELDLVIVLLSGGASALLPAPAEGLTLRDKQLMTKLLVRSGASIAEINAVRKHLSIVKGGRLAAAAWPATVLTLVISDVVGDDLSSIGSGPTAPDETTYADALAVLKRYALLKDAPAAALRVLRRGAKGELDETPKPGDEAFIRCSNIIVASNRFALAAARKKAVELGFKTIILTSSASGNTGDAARLLSSILKEAAASGNPVRPPCCMIMGGETTLKVTGAGLGGRNQEFALVAAMELSGATEVALLAAGTDGTDGPTDAAGAFALPDTLSSARALSMEPRAYLERNDSYNFFKAIGGLFVTGPTGTNVMDIAIGIVG